MSAIQPTSIPSPGAARITSAAIPTAEARMRDRSKVRARAGVRRLVLVVVAALVLAACYPPVDADDPYVAVAYEESEITAHMGLKYGEGVSDQGVTVNLALDLYLPPSHGEPRPLMVLVHGGSFCRGNRSVLGPAALEYARRGWIGATISYRTGVCEKRGGDLIVNVTNAGADGQLAIQWLRSQADVYGIDVDRIAMFGTSAGGGVALLAALEVDLTEGRHDGPESFNPTVSVGTGANLSIAIDAGLLPPTAPAVPVMMDHAEVDTTNGQTTEDVLETCLLWYDDGVKCHASIREGAGHVVSIEPTGPNFIPDFAPFLAAELDLANAATP